MLIRKAKLCDVEEMYLLVNNYADKGLMLSRPRSMLYEYIRDFVVMEEEAQIVGACALHILWGDLAEIRALAVKEGHQGRGVGQRMVDYCIKEARELCLPKVFTLTYQEKFFAKLGFVVVGKENMPQKVWRECINCPKFPNCDEICMEMKL